MLNTTLLKSANKIIGNPSPAQFIINAHFISSSEDSKFSFYPMFIKNIVIAKDYILNFADVIDLTMTISPKDYALLQDQGQNLLCILTQTYTNKTGKVVFTPPPRVFQYNVMINDPRDVRKAIPDIHVYTQPSLDMSVRLIEPTVYKLRHKKINTIYQNITVTDAIYDITKSLGINKLHLVPLHNEHQHDHIAISSYQGIDSIYGYLQSKCGLYVKGATSYLTNEVLYIYPPFETEPSYDKTAIFYQVDKGHFAGVNIFHRIENDNISIVINSEPMSYDLSIAGSENVGTGFIFSRASRMTDGVSTIDSKEGAQFTDQPALSISLNNSRTAQKEMNNVFHVKDTDNPFPAMSTIIAHQASLMEVDWMHADPFYLDPGHAITYYYDKNETMVKKTGILEKATYYLSPIEKMDTQNVFGAVGKLVLRLSPNETVVI